MVNGEHYGVVEGNLIRLADYPDYGETKPKCTPF